MKKILSIALIASIAFTACTKSAKLAKRITGKWNFTKWEKTLKMNNQLVQTVTIENKGSIELKDDGTGTYVEPGSATNVTYSITDWFNSEDVVMIKIKDGLNNEKPILFNVVTNEKSTQVWETTDTYYDQGGGKTELKYSISATKE